MDEACMMDGRHEKYERLVQKIEGKKSLGRPAL
jgi:hypothetical protein